MWAHASCCNINKEEYQQLSACGTDDWFCPTCTLAELPFSNCSFTSEPINTDQDLTLNTSDTDLATSDYQTTQHLQSPNKLSLCHLNVQCISNKLDVIHDFLNNSKGPLVLGLSETWLNNTFTDANVATDNYKLYRRDRTGKRGGGILVYVHDSIRSWRRPDLENMDLEAIWIELRLDRSAYLLCNIYRPPTSNTDFMDSLQDMLELATAESKEVVIMGDFNCNALSPSTLTNTLTSTMQDFQLTQLTVMLLCPPLIVYKQMHCQIKGHSIIRGRGVLSRKGPYRHGK